MREKNMCRRCFENEIFSSFTIKKLFEGVINLHYLSAKVIDPIFVKKVWHSCCICLLTTKQVGEGNESFRGQDKGQYFF